MLSQPSPVFAEPILFAGLPTDQLGISACLCRISSLVTFLNVAFVSICQGHSQQAPSASCYLHWSLWSVLNIDSTKKIVKKLQGVAAGSASWYTNVENERGGGPYISFNSLRDLSAFDQWQRV